MSLQLRPAAAFTLQQLTDAYNQTRVDYLVPMPMNAARLGEYVHIYQINLEQSVVAVDDDEILGLCMLGCREGRAWITRLGVLPVKRRRGVGETMLRTLLHNADQLGLPLRILEVIRDNTPAYQLFLKCQFHLTRELLVLRRPPGTPQLEPQGNPQWVEAPAALQWLYEYPAALPWTNQIETYAAANDYAGLRLTLPDGGRGWMIFRKQKFLLSHFVPWVEAGEPSAVTAQLLAHLHARYPLMDTHVENVGLYDPHLPAFLRLGYLDVFHRLEMYQWVA